MFLDQNASLLATKPGRLAAAACTLCAALLLCAAMCLFADADNTDPMTADTPIGDRVHLQATEAFQYFAYDGNDKWLLVRTPQQEIYLVQVTNRFYNAHLADLTDTKAPDRTPVTLTGRVVVPHPDVIRFGADAAALSESDFLDSVHGRCLDATRRSPAKQVSVYLLWAAAPFAVVGLFFLQKARD